MGKIIEFTDLKKDSKRKDTNRALGRLALKGAKSKTTDVWPQTVHAQHPLSESSSGVSAEFFAMSDKLQEYAAVGFRQAMTEFRRPYRVKLPENFGEIMRDPQGQLPKKFLQQIASLPVKKKVQLAYAMVVAAHDGWVRDNSGYFFDREYEDERFLFLRLELCGIYAYQRFRDLIAPTIARLGLETGKFSWDSESHYRRKRHQFVCENGLTNHNLAEYIANCGTGYTALSPEIAGALRRDPVLVGELASQVILRAPLGGIEYC